MNDLQIYQLMARKSNIRAVQVADAFDVELLVASNALRNLVDMGDVVRHSGAGPNGHPAQMYNLSETFKKSKAGAALVADAEKAAPAAVASESKTAGTVESPQPGAPTPMVMPVFAQQDTLPRARTKVEIAIEHLKANPGANDDDLRVAMGLPKGSSPASYLASARRAGRIVKTATGWAVGDGSAPSKPSTAPAMRRYNASIVTKQGPVAQFGKDTQPTDVANVVVVGNVVLASKDQKSLDPKAIAAVEAITRAEMDNLPSELIAQLSKPARAAAGHPPEGVFRCGIWSDGVLELQRDGQQLARLTRDEGEQLVAFMGRMLEAAASGGALGAA